MSLQIQCRYSFVSITKSFLITFCLLILAGGLRLRSMNNHPGPTSCHDPGSRTGAHVPWAVGYRATTMRI